MKNLQEIKDEVAIDYGWASWESCYSYNGFSNIMINEISIRYAQEQNKELQKWKESMTTIQNELDLQGIGNALGLKLGTSIAPQVLPKINELVYMLNQSKLMIGKLKRSMLVHPDCELGSEFCDYTTDAQNLEDEIEELIKSAKGD